MIWFVSPEGEARPYLTRKKRRPVVGPIFSIVDGSLIFSALMTSSEICELCVEEKVYFQKQLDKRDLSTEVLETILVR